MQGYSDLTMEQRGQVEFVQFHPGYDYSDFVEGLRPKMNDDGTMGFELQDGIFKKFVDSARRNYENSQKSKEKIDQETTAIEAISAFFESINFGVDSFKTITGNEFFVTDVDDKHASLGVVVVERSFRVFQKRPQVRFLVDGIVQRNANGRSLIKPRLVQLFLDPRKISVHEGSHRLLSVA